MSWRKEQVPSSAGQPTSQLTQGGHPHPLLVLPHPCLPTAPHAPRSMLFLLLLLSQVPLSQLVSPSGHQRGGYLSPPTCALHTLVTYYPPAPRARTRVDTHTGTQRHRKAYTRAQTHTHTHLRGIRCLPLPAITLSLPPSALHTSCDLFVCSVLMKHPSPHKQLLTDKMAQTLSQALITNKQNICPS